MRIWMMKCNGPDISFMNNLWRLGICRFSSGWTSKHRAVIHTWNELVLQSGLELKTDFSMGL